MNSSRSPRHPNISIKEAIELIRKIFKNERSNPMARETAAKHLGYSGISGASTKALANLMQYGLMERSGEGEIKVSGLTFKIMAPESEAEKLGAILDASENPDFFQELNERYPDVAPTVENLESYLIRRNFTDAALRDASKAYLETRAFVEGVKEDLFGEIDGRKSAGSGDSETGKLNAEAAESIEDVQVRDRNEGSAVTRDQRAGSTTLREDVFTLDEGPVSIQWPGELSEESFEDMKDWLELLVRKIGRSVRKS